MARRAQEVLAGDRLADRIGIGVLAKVFPPELVDRVVDQAGVREQRTRTLPARVVVAVDGMCLDLPDTPENAAEFGYPGNDAGRGPFRQVRVAGLGECGTRAGAGRGAVAAGDRGTGPGPQAAGQAQRRGPAAG